jgi:alpha,alpha-trehalase
VPVPLAGAVPTGEARRSPIAAYGLLADCKSACLVVSRGSIDWLCLPWHNSATVSPPYWARGGHWSIRSAGAFAS